MKKSKPMTTSVMFHTYVDVESVMWRNLRALALKYDDIYWIGGNMGVAIQNLDWREAMTVAAKIVVTILKSDSASIFHEMRLMVQPTVQESPSLSDWAAKKGTTPPP